MKTSAMRRREADNSRRSYVSSFGSIVAIIVITFKGYCQLRVIITTGDTAFC